jgi:hypothetical protein
MADRYDDLAATKAAAQQIADHYEQNNAAWRAAYDEGRHDDCVWHMRNAKALEAEARDILGTAQAQQQAQQQQLTEIEQDLLRSYPQIASDPKKWGVALIASQNLQLRGYDRNSPEYAQAIAHAVGVLNADLTESNEVASPDEMVRICQSKYGSVSPAEYNQGVQRLIEEKRAGKYPMSQ